MLICPSRISHAPKQTTSSCSATDDSCLTAGEATAVAKIWDGARDKSNNLLWPGITRGTDLGGLAGNAPFFIATAQPRYWVYLDPA